MSAQEYKNNTVMVVDDDPYVRSLIKMSLKDIVDVVEVEVGEDAAETYRRVQPNVVLLDIHLPCAEGLQVLRDLLRIDANAYVVMLSADSVGNNVRETYIAGARGFIAKPFEKKKLVDAVLASPNMRIKHRA